MLNSINCLQFNWKVLKCIAAKKWQIFSLHSEIIETNGLSDCRSDDLLGEQQRLQREEIYTHIVQFNQKFYCFFLYKNCNFEDIKEDNQCFSFSPLKWHAQTHKFKLPSSENIHPKYLNFSTCSNTFPFKDHLIVFLVLTTCITFVFKIYINGQREYHCYMQSLNRQHINLQSFFIALKHG